MISIAISLTMETKMSRLFFLPVSLVAAFAAVVIASPVAAVADEIEVQNDSARAESASSPGSMQGSEELTPGWNQADTCEWRIDDGALTLRPLGNGGSGELYSKPSWGSGFTRFAIEGTITLSNDGNYGWDSLNGVLFSSCSNLESVDLRGLRFGEDNYVNGFSGFFKVDLLEDLPALRSITIDSSFAYRCNGNEVKSPEFPGGSKFSRWVSSVDGIAYECDGYPSGVAATYTLQSAADVKNAWNQSESCLWKLDGNGLLTIKPQNGSEGVLSYDIDRDDDSSWLAFSSDIKSVVVKGTVKPHSNESGGDNSGPLFRNCSNLKTADLSGVSTDNGNAPINSSTFEGCSSLQSVTLGSAFVFAEGSAPWFPQNGATYRWASSVDGIAYECDGYPSGVAATYTLQDKGDVIGSWNQSGTCLWLLDEKGSLTVKPQNEPEGTLGQFYAYSDAKRDWLLFPNKISTVVFEDGVKAPGSISGLFQGCSKIKSIDFGSFDTADAEDMSYMFDRCSSLRHIDVSMLNTSNVKSMFWMFQSCSSLESLELSNFNTSKLEDARGMFGSCSALKELDLSNLDTSRVSEMGSMFDGCSKLRKINLSNFSTVSAHGMDGMFYNCTSLKELDLSSFDTSSASSMNYFFGDTSSLEKITIGDNFITPSDFSFPEHDMSYTELRWKNESGVEFAPNEVPTGKKGTYVVVKKRNPDNPAYLPRIAGETRYETAEQIAYQGSWPTGGSVILASGANFPDALAASALAGEENAPVLLTESGSLSDSTSNVLANLKPSTIYVVGGEAAVSARAASEASSVAGNAELVRLSGDTRYETALAVASEVGAASDAVIVATAEGYADALSVSPWAFATSSPVILCDPREGLSDSSLSFIRDNGFSKAIIVGGTSAVPGQVESQLKGANIDSTQRLSGPTRYETSAEIAEFELAGEIGFEADGILFATGNNYPDALSAGPLAGKGLSPLLLVDPGAEQASKFAEGHKNEINNATIIGGYSAVSYEEEQTILGALNV